MALLTLSDRDTAGSTYGTAATNFINALVDLAAKEQILQNRGFSLDGGYFGAIVGAMSLIEFKHGKYAPSVAAATAAQLVSARVQALIAAGN